MATSEEKDQTGVIKSLRGPITRRQAIKAGGIAVVGLAFSKPLIETVWPKPAFAQYVTVKGQGCTPGYWKQRHHLDSWMPTGFSPDQTVVSVFSAASAFPILGSVTLLRALSFRGGPGSRGAARILLRAAVAAVLNAAHPAVNYPRTVVEVVNDVNAALASGNRDTMLDLAGDESAPGTLDGDNNLGCTLS